MGQRANRFVSDNSGIIENFLEFAGCRARVFCRQISLSPKIGWIEGKGEIFVRVSQFVRCGRGQSLDGGLGVSAIEGESRPRHWQISSLNSSVLGKSLCQVIDRAIGVGDIT